VVSSDGSDKDIPTIVSVELSSVMLFIDDKLKIFHSFIALQRRLLFITLKATECHCIYWRLWLFHTEGYRMSLHLLTIMITSHWRLQNVIAFIDDYDYFTLKATECHCI